MAVEECKKMVEAVSEIISEEACEDGEFSIARNVGDGILAWIPEGSLEVSTHSPDTPEEREEAIESCMAGDWARSWQRSITGPSAPKEIAETTRRVLCTGLYD